MKEFHVQAMSSQGVYKRKKLNGKITETHISWVILTRKYAFKIKKPVRLSFLNFTTIQRRKRYCEIEMALNARFSNIYLSVEPIRFVHNQWKIGKGKGDIVEYCVVMKRMSVRKRMDSLLQRNKVDRLAIQALAKEIAEFHKTAEVIVDPFKIEDAKRLFNEIGEYAHFISENINPDVSKITLQCISMSDRFLESNAHRIQERITKGFKRDVHGDLHSGNIFLYRRPVLFDCIEFKDEFRKIDILYEIAFLCMDIEFYDENGLSEFFVSEYLKYIDCVQTKDDYALFIYFKCLRANIRARIHAISASQGADANMYDHHIEMLKRYLVLMDSYRVVLG